MSMKVLPVSGFSYKNNINFSAKKTEKNDNNAVLTSVRKSVPTAALILAMAAAPPVLPKAEASELMNETAETQWFPYVPPVYYYNPYYNYILPTAIMMNYLQTVTAMNNIYTTPVSPVSVGNVAFNERDIQFVGLYEDEGVDYYNVVLKNGTSVTFPEQAARNYAAIYRNNNGYMFEGLSNAYIQGSVKKDKYTLNGCRNTLVDISGDDKSDRVLVQRYRITPNNTRQYTENVSVTAGRNDVVNNRKILSDGETSTYDGY